MGMPAPRLAAMRRMSASDAEQGSRCWPSAVSAARQRIEAVGCPVPWQCPHWMNGWKSGRVSQSWWSAMRPTAATSAVTPGGVLVQGGDEPGVLVVVHDVSCSALLGLLVCIRWLWASPDWPVAWLVRASKLMRRASAAGVFGLDQPQVVDPGRRRRWWCGLLRAGLGVGVAADDLRGGQSHRFAVVAYFDAGQIEWVEDEFHGAPGQERVDLVGVAEQADRGGLADLPVD